MLVPANSLPRSAVATVSSAAVATFLAAAATRLIETAISLNRRFDSSTISAWVSAPLLIWSTVRATSWDEAVVSCEVADRAWAEPATRRAMARMSPTSWRRFSCSRPSDSPRSAVSSGNNPVLTATSSARLPWPRRSPASLSRRMLALKAREKMAPITSPTTRAQLMENVCCQCGSTPR